MAQFFTSRTLLLIFGCSFVLLLVSIAGSPFAGLSPGMSVLMLSGCRVTAAIGFIAFGLGGGPAALADLLDHLRRR